MQGLPSDEACLERSYARDEVGDDEGSDYDIYLFGPTLWPPNPLEGEADERPCLYGVRSRRCTLLYLRLTRALIACAIPTRIRRLHRQAGL